MASGATGSVNIPMEISESCDISYSVKAVGSSTNTTKETNSIHITVLDAETPTEEATSEKTPTGIPEETSTAQPTVEKANGLGSTNVLLIVIIGVLLVLIGVMAVFVIKIMKKQMDEKNNSKNSDK